MFARIHIETKGIGRFCRRAVAPGFALLALAEAVAVGFAAGRVAAEEPDLRSRFAGYVEVAPQVIVQKGRGSVGTNFELSSRKSNYLTNMTFRFGGGVKGPEIVGLWGRPRPVLYGGAIVPLDESSTIGNELIETNPPGEEVAEGAKFSIEYQTSGMAGLGLEFIVPFLESEIRITPAVESLHLVSRYVGEGTYTVAASNPNVPDEQHEIRAKKEIVQHLIGPALRVATPTVIVRGFAIDLFLGASVVFDVAGTREEIDATGENGDRGQFTFETGKGAAQVTTGFQVRWP